MPLLRYYKYSQGAQIHIASFPPAFEHPNMIASQGHTGAIEVLCKAAALEGQMFVLQPSMIISELNREKAGLGKFKISLVSICFSDLLCYAKLTCRFSLEAATLRFMGRMVCLWRRNCLVTVKKALCMRILALRISSVVQNTSSM